MEDNKSIIGNVLENIAKASADSASWLFYFEPKMPECLNVTRQ